MIFYFKLPPAMPDSFCYEYLDKIFYVPQTINFVIYHNDNILIITIIILVIIILISLLLF